jgi:hypothetical protein
VYVVKCWGTAQETFRTFAKMNVAPKEINYRLPMFDVAQKIKVQMIDGHAIFEGDIILYEETGGVGDAGISGNNYRSANGIIPYVIEAIECTQNNILYLKFIAKESY